MIRKYILIIMCLIIPLNVFAVTFEGVGATSTNSIDMLDGTYICSDISALNYLATSSEQDVCVYTPPTMFEIIVINTSIIAFASFIWLIRLIADNKNKRIL